MSIICQTDSKQTHYKVTRDSISMPINCQQTMLVVKNVRWDH